MAEEQWRLGDEKDGMPAMVRWPATNGRHWFNLYSYEEAQELKDLMNTYEADHLAASRYREALREIRDVEVYEADTAGMPFKHELERATQEYEQRWGHKPRTVVEVVDDVLG